MAIQTQWVGGVGVKIIKGRTGAGKGKGANGLEV